MIRRRRHLSQPRSGVRFFNSWSGHRPTIHFRPGPKETNSWFCTGRGESDIQFCCQHYQKVFGFWPQQSFLIFIWAISYLLFKEISQECFQISKLGQIFIWYKGKFPTKFWLMRLHMHICFIRSTKQRQQCIFCFHPASQPASLCQGFPSYLIRSAWCTQSFQGSQGATKLSQLGGQMIK